MIWTKLVYGSLDVNYVVLRSLGISHW